MADSCVSNVHPYTKHVMCANLLLLHSHSLDESIGVIILLFKLHLLSSQLLFEIIHLWVGEGEVCVCVCVCMRKM